MTNVGWILEVQEPSLARSVAALRERLADGGLVDAGEMRSAADLRAADVVMVWADRALAPHLAAAVADPAVRCVLAGPTLVEGDPDGVLAEAAGLRVGGTTPVHDVRLRAGAHAGPGLSPAVHQHGDASHHDEHHHLVDRVVLVEKVTDDVQVLRTARVGLTDHPVLTWRPSTATAAWTMGSTPAAVDDRGATRGLVQLISHLTGVPAPPPVRVGLLGYGAIGHEHSRAVRAVDGLALAAVCDTSDERLTEAVMAAGAVATTHSADDLIGRDDVDLIVVSTPPSTHAAWALRAVEAGKHVVVEKPFAISTREADDVMAAAAAADLLAVVYQNRRYDPDYLALRRLVRGDRLGEVFHVETFVGGHGHPCNLWHSDESVSGGAFYDWGSHLLDQVLDLMPWDVEHVTAATHKLRWFDVTNADHSRVTVRFVNGAEAEFVHSDLAAAPKPRWYVVGTRGTVVGSWRTEKVVSRNDIGTLVEDVLAPADSPPLLDLYTDDGSVTRVAQPAPEPYLFHHELADRLQWGLPMSVTAEQSRRVLAVMEAASLSAADDARPVVPR